MRIIIRVVSLLSIFISVILSISWLWYNNMYFHTDIARDFLILQDMYYGRHITLLGPRAGGVEGVFHGPLWFYLNLPAYILGHGNPVYVGWFWVILFILLISIVFFVARNWFNTETAYLSAALVAVQGIDIIKMLLNPYGAVIISPLIFYSFYLYIEHKKVRHLALFVFLTGLSIQFEMAFGIPILVLGFLYSFVTIIKTKRYTDLLTYLVLLVPLSTFIIFDVRHHFLQTNAFLSYFSGHDNGAFTYNFAFLWSRIAHLLDVTNMFSAYQQYLSLLVMGLFLGMLIRDRKTKDKYMSPLWLFAYFYFGYSLLCFFLFKREIWSYYTMPFLPIFAIVFTYYALKTYYRPVIYLLFFIIIGLGLKNGLYNTYFTAKTSLGDGSAWQFNLHMAEHIFSENKNQSFGYYVYTPDLFGYGPRYAMDYVQKQTGKTEVYPYQKKDIVYLIMSPAPFHIALSSEDWKKYEVKMNRPADKKITYPNGYIVEMYKLTKEEQSVSSNQNMIQSVIMR